MKTIRDNIQNIEGLYPIDCEFKDTAEVGKVLLLKAIENTKYDWRDLPIEVLQEYERLCIDEENDGEVTHYLKGKGII